jgi:hypothetical protein
MNAPDPAGVVTQVLEAAAGSAFGDLTGPPVDVETIAEELCGLRVSAADLGVRVRADHGLPAGVTLSGLLLADERRLLYDAGEGERSPGRRRFTIAHELGHWYLHAAGGAHTRYCRSDEVGITVTSTREREREANRFAGALLMPEAPVRSEAARLRGNVGVLARRFGVSAPAMQVRLQQLDLLPSYMR